MALLDYDKPQLDLGGGVLAATQEENWDWFNKHVERAAFPDTIACPESTLILAGPATYEEVAPVSDEEISAGESLLTPIGFVNEVGYREGASTARLGEIGSRMPRFVADRTAASGSIQRALFNAHTLAYVLYQNALKSTSKRNADNLYAPILKSLDSGDASLRHVTGIWSDLFRIPFGMCVCYRTVGNDYLASVFLEQCYINSYQGGVSVGQAVQMEQISFEFERVRPVKVDIQGAAISSVLTDTGSS